MKSFIKKLLREGLQRVEYHATSFSSVLSILKTNRLNLSSHLGGSADKFGDRFFFLSLSRTGYPKLAYGQKGKSFARIVFNGDLLNNNFKSVPFDYWGTKGSRDINDASFEYEDRILTDKPYIDNIFKYIDRIDILTSYNDYELKIIKKIIDLSIERGVTVNVYDDVNNLIKGRDTINDKFSTDEYSGGEDNMDKYRSHINYSDFVTLMLLDPSYFDDGGKVKFKKDFDKFVRDNEISYKDSDAVYERMRSLFFYEQDFIQSFKSNLHNYFKSGEGGEFRDDVKLLIKEMRKWGVNSINSLVRIKLHGIKEKGKFVDYSNKFQLYYKEYGEWIEYGNPTLENSRIYFNTGRYGGYVSENDMDIFFKYRDEGKRLNDFINYLLNEYTFDKVASIIYKSGYNKYSEEYEFMLKKK